METDKERFRFLESKNEQAYLLFVEADKEKSFIPTVDDPNFEVDHFLDQMEKTPGYVLFVTQNEFGDNLGFISVFPHHRDEGVYSIGPMYVKKEFRGKSIGKYQVEKVIEWASNERIKKLHTKTWGNNIGSRKIFEDLGFKLTKEKPNDRINGDSTVTYELML